MNTPRTHAIAGCIGVILAALALRVWGAGWSLPYVDHPDEPAVMNVILRMLRAERDDHLNPHHFFYPSLMFYLHAALLKLHFWLGGLSGLYPPDFTLPRSTHFYTSVPAAFAWARVVTALLGTAAVAALACWSGRFVGWRAGLLAAALLAFSAWATIHAHYITVDGPSALTGLLALLACLLVLEQGTWRSYLLAGVLVGLATGTKYQNVVVVVSLALAHGFYWRGALVQRLPRLVAAGGLSALVFFATSPYILLDFAGFQRDMQTLFDSYGGGTPGDVGRPWPVDAYLRFHWREGLGPLPTLLVPVGIVALWRQSPARAAVLLAFPLLMLLALLRLDAHFYRNLLPAQAPLFLLAAVGAVALWDATRPWRTRLPAWSNRAAAGVALVMLLVPPLVGAIQSSARLARPDSRVVAQEWARREYPGVRISAELSHPMRWQGVSQATYQHFLPLHPPAWYLQQGYGVLLTNSGRRGGRDEWIPAYDPLREAGTIVATFGGRSSAYLGPRVDLIDTGLTPATLPDTPVPSATTVGPLRLLGLQYGKLERDPTGQERTAQQQVQPGDILAITAFWLADGPVLPDNYTTFVHLRNTAGQNITQRDAPIWQGLFPPHTWQPGQVASESLDLFVPEGVPSGSYRLVFGLYNSDTGTRYPLRVDGVQLPDDELVLGRVEVRGER